MNNYNNYQHGDFITTSEAARRLGGGESTWRKKAANGEIPGAYKPSTSKMWLLPHSILGFGRGPEHEQAEHHLLSDSVGARDIVLAKDEDGRYGIYIEADWYGADEALEILGYLSQHEQWLKDANQKNSEQK